MIADKTMHYIYLVAVPVEEADTPTSAIQTAEQELDSNEFAGEGGYFTSHKADWYEVGGRWSNFFTLGKKWAQTATKEINEMVKANKFGDEEICIVGTHYGDDRKTKAQTLLREKAELIWGKHRPADYPKVRYDRYGNEDGTASMGINSIEDCAEVVTKELLDYIKKKEKEWRGDDPREGIEVYFTDECHEELISDIKPEDIIGKYWFVVIDYHT